MNIIPFRSAGIVNAVLRLPGCFSIQCGKGKYKQNKWLMKVVLRISYLAMSPVDTPSLPAGAVPCVECPVLRTASLTEPSRAWKGRIHARHPQRSRPVRGKPGFTHGIPSGAVPCVGSPDLRTASQPKPVRAGEGWDSSKVKVFRAKMAENLSQFS